MEDRSDSDRARQLEEEVEAVEGEDRHRCQDTMLAFPSRNIYDRRESKCVRMLVCEASKVGIIIFTASSPAVIVFESQMSGVNKSKKKHGIMYKDDPGAKAAELESFLFGAKSEEANHIFARDDDEDDSTSIAELLKKVCRRPSTGCSMFACSIALNVGDRR